MNNQISDIEVKAEVFRVVLANQNKTSRAIYELIEEQLSETGATKEQIIKAIHDLLGN